MSVVICGGFSFVVAKYGVKEVIGVDVNYRNIEQANTIRKYLKAKNVKFSQKRVEEINEKDLGKFDIIILAGILYHLSDLIGTMAKIGKVVKSNTILIVDCHIHYTTGSEEDIPSWWMLNDIDEGDLEGLFVGDEILSAKKYLEFEKNTKIDYGKLQNQFVPSPHTERDIEFIKKYLPHPNQKTANKYIVGLLDIRGLVLIPNKRAIYRLIRYFGFEDILEINTS